MVRVCPIGIPGASSWMSARAGAANASGSPPVRMNTVKFEGE
jgi:hypothetical protein